MAEFAGIAIDTLWPLTSLEEGSLESYACGVKH